MRSSQLSVMVATVMGLSLFFAFGCGNDTSSTVTSGSGVPVQTAPAETPIPFPQGQAATASQENPSPYGAGTTGAQAVGTLIDGLQLRDIRWADHGAYFRVVFELGTADGQPVLQVPHAETSMSPDHKQIKVVLGGIRSIGTSENVTSTSLGVAVPPVTTISRLPEADDQALVYSIELASPATYSLAGVGSPGRIIIDINKA